MKRAKIILDKFAPPARGYNNIFTARGVFGADLYTPVSLFTCRQCTRYIRLLWQ